MIGRPLFFSVAVVTASVVSLAAGQDPQGLPPTTFEAASVKANRSGDTTTSVRRQPGGRFNAVNVPLRPLLTLAFQIQGYQLVDAPDWVDTERFDIVAKIEGDPPPMPPGSPNDPMIQALRALLVERFNLAVHRERRDLDIYALAMATPGGTPGPALRQSTQDCPRALNAARAGGPPPVAQPGAPPVLCGIRTAGPGRVVAGGATLTMLVSGLSPQVGRFIDDRTGLTGGWDFELTFAPDAPRGPLPAGVEPPAADPNAPSLFTALREQLGLKLEATKGPVDVLVIDRVSRPSPD